MSARILLLQKIKTIMRINLSTQTTLIKSTEAIKSATLMTN
jgi:hypothetical protein